MIWAYEAGRGFFGGEIDLKMFRDSAILGDDQVLGVDTGDAKADRGEGQGRLEVKDLRHYRWGSHQEEGKFGLERIHEPISQMKESVTAFIAGKLVLKWV